MRLRTKRTVAQMLAVTMTLTTLSSCASNSSNPDTSASAEMTQASSTDAEGSVAESSATQSTEVESTDVDTTADSQSTEPVEDEAKEKVTASAVKFLSSGKYTTTVKAEDPSVDLSSLSKDNVEVTYIGLEKNSVVAVPEITQDETGALVLSCDSYADGERIAALDDVKKNDDGTWSVSFTDENAVKYGVSQYSVRLKNQKMTVPVEVDLGEMKVTPDITEVSAADTEIKVTLTLEGGEFADSVERDMISVSNAFEKMKVESVSASGKNMTMLLTGNVITYGQYGAYLVGTVAVAPEAVKDCGVSLRANIGIADEFAGFDPTTLKVEDDNITVELKSEGAVDIDSLNAENIKIEGVIVEKVEKKDDTTAVVTMSADDVNSCNDFAKLVADKQADFGGFVTTPNLSQASFYPVFDYCEADGSNLKMTLIMYAYCGIFDKDIDVDGIKLGLEFEGGKAESIAVAEDGSTAELIISVPAGEQKEDDFEFYGEIKLPADSMINKWGEKNSDELSYDRVYSNETLGKAVNWPELWKKFTWDEGNLDIRLRPVELRAIQDWVRGKDTWYGSIFYYLGAAGSGISGVVGFYSGIVSCLAFFGALKSDQQLVMEEFQQIKQMLNKIDQKLDKQRKQLINLEKEAYRNSLEQYEIAYTKFLSKMRVVERAYQKGAEDLAKMGITLSDTATIDESKIYNRQLMNYIFKRAEENGGSDPDFGSFKTNFESFRESFNQIAGYYMGGTGLHCPLEKYDKLYALMYNFDTQSYASRFLNRVTLRANLTEAIPLLATRYQFVGTYEDVDPGSDFGEALTNYQKAIKTLESREVEGISPDDVVFGYVEKEVDEKIDKTYIKDILLYGDEKDIGISQLDSMGYYTIRYDLNEKAGGYYIYLGYKTTDKYSEAIKDLMLVVGKGKNKDTLMKDGCVYSQSPIAGDNYFCNKNYNRASREKHKKGDLNMEAGGDYIYLYYTRDETKDKTAITDIYVNNYKKGSVDETDLNKGAGGEDIFLHVSKVPEGGTYITSLKLEAKKLDDKEVTDYDTEKSDAMESFKTFPQNLNQGNNTSNGYHIYLGCETENNYEKSIKDIRIVSGTKGRETFVYDGRIYHLCGVSDSDKGFADSKGDLNYNGTANITDQSLYIYYTTDKLADDMGVTDVTFDNVGLGAVCGMNLNSFAGGDVIYMHLDRQNDLNYRRTVKVVGSDPNYHPYSYVFNDTINLVDMNSITRNNIEKFKGRTLGLRANRGWTDEEINEFVEKMAGRTVGEELEMAGIPFKNRMLFTYLNRVDAYSDNVYFEGSAFKQDSRTGTVYINQASVHVDKNGKPHFYADENPTFFELD